MYRANSQPPLLHPPSPGQARSQRWLLLHDARLRQEIHSPSLSSLLSLSSVTSPSPYRPPPLHLPGLTGVCSWCVVPRGFIFSFTLCIDRIVGFSFVLHPRLIPSRPEPCLSSAHTASLPDCRLSRFLFFQPPVFRLLCRPLSSSLYNSKSCILHFPCLGRRLLHRPQPISGAIPMSLT